MAKIWTTLCDARGNPSRWVALALAAVFAIGAVVVAVLGQGVYVTGLFTTMFVTTFNVAFGKPTVNQAVIAVVRRNAPPSRKR